MTDYKKLVEDISDLLEKNKKDAVRLALSGFGQQGAASLHASSLDEIENLIRDTLDEEQPEPEADAKDEEQDPTLDISAVFGAMGPIADVIFGKGSNASSDVQNLLKGLFGDVKK